ncbi:STT3 domain-containing protein [Candidatus Harpocratesius sp.]
MANKVKTWFTDIGDRIKTSVKIDKDAPFFYISLLIIFILAVIVRLSPVVQGTFLIKAFDPWYQYDSTKKLIDMGFFNWFHFHDYKFWYPEGVDRFNLRPGLLITNALIYKFLIALGFNVTVFQVVYYFPAVMGGLTVVVMYYLGKEVLDRRAGLLAAFFLAFSPGHMQRTVAGFYDNETIGVFAILLEFLFFIRATKYGRLSDGLFAGLSLGYLALSWGGLSYGFLLLPLIVGVLILTDKYDSKVFMAYTTTVGVGFLLSSLDRHFSWNKTFQETEYVVSLLFLVFLIAYHYLYALKGTERYKQILTAIKWSMIPISAAVVIILWIDPSWLPFNLGARLQSIINPSIREEIHLVASVGEHSPSPWSVYYFNALIPVLLVIPGIFFALRRANIEDILMVIFVITLFYFTGSMVRIILLFAPAMALIGGYALSTILKFFGNLMKDQPTITRRRKRQLKRTLAKSEGIVVYFMIGILLFVQANHAIDMSADQLGYSELVAAGAFHDWEETFTWMKYNLDSSTVVVSWWDYGYWITTIGNVTTVNDNGTWNQTRIGLTGMAFMQTNEQFSAEVFRALKADYVLVYFGHLLNGLGGDEGKWPWMLRICNDNTKFYEGMSNIPKDNWYGGDDSVDTVFNEDYYVNSSSGKYYASWFNTTLVKLMFADEITSSSQLSDNSPYTAQYLVSALEGSDSQPGRTDSYGNPWTNYDTVNGNYQLQYFTPAYYSINRLVKVFKVDYDALDSAFQIKDTYIDTNGLGYAIIENTGTTSLDLQQLIVSDNVNNYPVNFTVEDANEEFAPGDTRYVWFDSTEIDREQFGLNDGYHIEAEMKVSGSTSTYSFSNTSVSTTVVLPKLGAISIDKGQSYFEYTGSDYSTHLALQNTGELPLEINEIHIAGEVYNQTQIESILGRKLLVVPNSTEEIVLAGLTLPIATDFSQDASVSIYTIRGPSVQSIISQSNVGYSIGFNPSILSDLPETEYRFDQSTYQPISSSLSKNVYVNYNNNSYLLDNGTLYLDISNTGDKMFSLQNIITPDDTISIYDIQNAQGEYVNPLEGDNYQLLFVNPGETRKIRAEVSNVELNEPKLIAITATVDGQRVTRNSALFVPRSATPKVAIINSTDAQSFAFTNETVRLTLKNIGFDPITLDQVVINGTETIDLNETMVREGSLSLLPDEIAVIEFPISTFAVNLTNTLSVQVNIDEDVNGFSVSTINSILPTIEPVFAIVPPGQIYPHQIDETYASVGDDLIHLVIQVENEQVVNIDSIMFSLTGDSNDYQYLNLTAVGGIDLRDEDNNPMTGLTLTGGVADDTTIQLFYLNIDPSIYGITLTQDEPVYLKIRTLAGYEATITLTVKA